MHILVHATWKKRIVQASITTSALNTLCPEERYHVAMPLSFACKEANIFPFQLIDYRFHGTHAVVVKFKQRRLTRKDSGGKLVILNAII